METQITAEDIFKEYQAIIAAQAHDIASLRALINSMQNKLPQ
jgi:hypothetical protein